MQTDALTRLETRRLILRPFTAEDHPMILRIASDPDTVRYMYFWGRDGVTPETDARRFLDYAIQCWAEKPLRAREYCLVRKSDGAAMGNGSLEWTADEPDTAELGWFLLPEYRGCGYVTEMAEALLRAGFEALGARTVIARCDKRNAPSYRVMERLGMRLVYIEPGGRPAKASGETPGDECTYAIPRQEWQIRQAWKTYRTYTCHFDDFLPPPPMTDGEISLTLDRLSPADPAKGYVPAYHFFITRQGERIGCINLRIGYPDSLLYGGQIGYSVDEAWRGRGYAGTACRLLRPLMRAHGMPTAIITNHIANAASRRVCEKLGARFLCRIAVPESHEMYAQGIREVNVFAMDAQ